MEIALLFARLLLASVFAMAGVAKLADRDGARRAIIDFGVPVPLASPLGVLLPIAELAVAASLVPTASAWWGALGALALLLFFVVGIGANLARGRRPDCHCFGQLHSAPAGWSTLARNGALAVAAGFVIWQGRDNAGPSVVGWLSALSIYQLLGLIGGLVILGLLAAQWWFIFGLFRQNGRLLARLAVVEERLIAAGLTPTPSQNESQTAVGLPVGAPAPAFGLQDLQGEEVTLDSLLALGMPVVLLFSDPACGPCAELLPEIAYWQREHADELTISLISRGTADENLAESSEHGLTGVLLQEDREVFESYRAYGTPSAVLVRPDGTIGSTLAGGEEAIEHLVAQAAEVPTWVPLLPGTPTTTEAADHGKARPAAPRTREVGEPAPSVELPDLAGNTVKLEQFRGRETLVLFWNLGCGFCQQMLPDLQEWEENSPEGVPELLVVSTGTKKANEEMGLSSPVVLDQGFSAGRAFGAAGTPSAVLIDAEGRVASELAVGAPAVLELLTRSGRPAA